MRWRTAAESNPQPEAVNAAGAAARTEGEDWAWPNEGKRAGKPGRRGGGGAALIRSP